LGLATFPAAASRAWFTWCLAEQGAFEEGIVMVPLTLRSLGHVQDYGKWKAAFDAHGATRKASGSKGGRLLRNAEDPNELVIL
jgi:hypothetical protein